MPHLATILPSTNVLLDVDASGKQHLFEQVAVLLEKHCSIARTTVLESLLAREALGSTGLGRGVAVPHGRVKGLKGAMAAFVRLKEPIPFDSPDGQPVKILIVVLIPDNVTQQHLEILSEIAEMFSNEAFRTMLANELDANAIHAKIVAWKPGQQAA
jgi:nitrogen PTS system EIIA component